MSDATIEADAPTVDMPEPAVAPSHLPAIVDPAKAFMPVPYSDIQIAAKMLAAMPGLAKEFKDPANCEAVAYQAARWRLDPIYVASQAYFASGHIGYMAQLVHSLILANAPISRRPRLQYGYGGDGTPKAMNRFVKVFFYMIGEDEPFTLTTPTVAQIRIRNSPLWLSDPDQQLAYYGLRAAARRFCPDTLAGVYVPEELVQIRDMDAKPARPLFEEDEPIDAEFEGIPPTEADAAGFTRWEEKAEAAASKDQPSRDPRDAPANAGPPGPPPQGSVELDDMVAIMTFVTDEQARILAMTGRAAVTAAWNALVGEKRFKRLIAYNQAAANAVKEAVNSHLKGLPA